MGSKHQTKYDQIERRARRDPEDYTRNLSAVMDKALDAWLLKHGVQPSDFNPWVKSGETHRIDYLGEGEEP